MWKNEAYQNVLKKKSIGIKFSQTKAYQISNMKANHLSSKEHIVYCVKNKAELFQLKFLQNYSNFDQKRVKLKYITDYQFIDEITAYVQGVKDCFLVDLNEMTILRQLAMVYP